MEQIPDYYRRAGEYLGRADDALDRAEEFYRSGMKTSQRVRLQIAVWLVLFIANSAMMMIGFKVERDAETVRDEATAKYNFAIATSARSYGILQMRDQACDEVPALKRFVWNAVTQHFDEVGVGKDAGGVSPRDGR